MIHNYTYYENKEGHVISVDKPTKNKKISLKIDLDVIKKNGYKQVKITEKEFAVKSAAYENKLAEQEAEDNANAINAIKG